MALTKRYIFNRLYDEQWSKGTTDQVEYIINILDSLREFDCSSPDKRTIYRNRISAFISNLKNRWNKCQRKLDYFLNKNQLWLDSDFNIFGKTSVQVKGRPEKDFDTLCNRSKKRRTEELRTNTSLTELTFAASTLLRENGNHAAASIIDEIIKDPSKVAEIQQAWNPGSSKQRQTVKYTPDKALCLKLDGKLSVAQYQHIRKGALERNVDLYPSYKDILEAQNRCYPQSIVITDIGAEVKLQQLLDHTTERLLISQESVLRSLLSNYLQNLIILSKWSCDGSSGYNRYKQALPSLDFDDSSLFIASLAPWQLFALTTLGKKVIIWQNSRPSIAYFCRPIKFEFIKESAQLIQDTKNKIESQIQNLDSTRVCLSNLNAIVSHRLHFTMIDGKIANVITSTSSSMCYVCNVKPNDMNDIEQVLKRPVKTETYAFGLSTLHGWIRSFECLLHIAYRLDCKKWRVSQEDKKNITDRKITIQNAFKEKMNLIVDQPKAGFGSSNDGNTARRFFSQPTISAEITGIDENLIKRFSTILRTLSSGYEINIKLFEDYCLKTATDFVKLYPWYKMPATIHKILIHGPHIVKAAPLPIGQFSEEAQEARNKDCKKIREFNTRKMSRKETNEDLFHLFLQSSDALISSLRKVPLKQNSPFPLEVLALLNSPEIGEQYIFEAEM